MHRYFASTIVAFAGLAAACDTVPPPSSPETSAYPATVNYNTNVYAGALPVRDGPAVAPSDPLRIAVLPSSKLDRPAEVVGVVDVHEPMANEDAALARLREKAAALGADAVLGVEFHHGEARGEPIHLSGMAVRYTTPGP